MAKLVLHRRLRPLRIAFLIKPGDRAEFRQAVQVCSALWGGQFNFIVSAIRRARRSHGRMLETAKAILEAIEPDFVVGGGVDPRAFAVPQERSRTFEDFATPGRNAIGIDVMAAYRWRYQRDFRYVLRDPIPLRRCCATGRLSLFAATCFGEAPAGRRQTLDRAFGELGGETRPFNAEAFADVWTESMTPLKLGASEIGVQRGARTAFLLIDPRHVDDLVDVWNLRALGWRVFPIPVDWASVLVPRISEWITRHHSPSPPLPQVVTRAVVARGKGVSDRDLTAFVSKLKAPEGYFAVCPTVPRVTSASPLDDLCPPTLSAREDDASIETTPEGFAFNGLRPEFETGYGGRLPMCATVVSLRSWALPNLPEVFPRGVRDDVFGGLAKKGTLRIHTEGITLIDDGPGSSCWLNVPSGLSVFQGWLAPEISTELSAAGNLAHRMLHAMGGPRHSGIWTRPAIVRLFERINKSASRSILHARFIEALRRECVDDAMTQQVFKQWIARRVIALGMKVQCTKCGQRNWFESVTQFRTLECQRCLESFPFPLAKPGKDVEWAVRTLGPFSVEGHAQGAFAMTATLRLLEELGAGTRTTWVPSVLLKRGDKEREVDFMMLRQNETRPSPKPLLVLGECKTFCPFKQDDVEKMMALGQEFPGAVLVFAKLGDDFDAKESRLLRKLATRCRRGPNANPILLLTSRELCGDFGPPHCWQSGSADEQAVARTMHLWQFDFLRICDASVQIRLGLPPPAERSPLEEDDF
jgi:hypothetical protein